MLLGGGPFIGLIVMLICIIVEFFVKIIIKFGIKKEIKREEAITNQRENELMDEHSQELAEVMMSKNSEIVNFEKEQKIEYYKYLEDFNKNVQKGIIECASSKNAIEVAEWLTKEYSKIITERLKENDTEKQEVTFSFKVYSDYINCSMGNYTLSEKLEGQSKQEALAKCIEANVKFNIMQKYPQLNVAESSYSNDMLSYKSTLIYTL